MKRLLSLLVVIAMLVAMIPNVFATKEDVDFDELTGRLVVLEDIGSFDVVLAEGSDGMIYQWTPAEDEEATELILSWYPETAVLNVTATQGESTATATTENGFGELTLPIVAGELVEIEVSEANGAAVESAYIYGSLSGYPEGHESNPIAIEYSGFQATIKNAAWFGVRYGGTVVIEGEGAFNVIYEGETIAAVDGKVEIEGATAQFGPAPLSMFQIDTAGTYTFTMVIPVGSMENPAELVMGKNTAEIAANAQGYFYTWTATEEGTLKITMPAGNWTYQINNLTSYQYGDTQYSDSDPVVNPAEIAVAEGDEIQIIVNTYDPAAWSAPAGSITFTAELVLPEPPAPALTIVSQPESITRLAGEAASFTVVAEGEGLTYKWQYRNAGETSWRNTSLSGYNTATLNVTDAVYPSTHHGRQYKCIITDANGNSVETEPATLTVPYLINDAAHQNVQIGEYAEFTVNYSIKEGVTYQWQYKNNNGGAWTNTTSEGNKTPTLKYLANENRNRYAFRCRITDPNVVDEDGNVAPFYSKEVYMNIVEDPAEIVKQPESVTALLGLPGVFTIEATGDGLKYQWQWQAADGAWCDTKAAGFNTATLSAPTTLYNNGRQFRCKVRTFNGTGWNEVISEVVTLTVLPAATVVEDLPDTITVKAGETATIHIGAEGEGLTYQWQWAKYAGSWKNTTLATAQTDTLVVENVRADMNGRYYRVVITNQYGGYLETKKVQLIVE